VTPPVIPEPEPFVEPAAAEPPKPEPAPQFEQERLPENKPADLPPSALNIETRTDSAPSPPRRARAEQPSEEQKQDPPSRPSLSPANGSDKHSAAFVDDILNTQERNLLRELQDELARREQQESLSSTSNYWQVDRSSRHGKNGGPFDHPNQTTGPMIINGVPPHRPDNGFTR
jgi:outer membrane biosynthesis protein TonB